MAYKIPKSTVDKLFKTYHGLVDQAYEMFAVECDVIYLPKIEAQSQDLDNHIPEFNSINSRRRSSPDIYDNSNQTIIHTENSEKVRLRIYWSAKDWQSVYGYTTVPENHVMFLAYLRDSLKLNSAVKARFTDKVGNVYIFNRQSECIPYAFNKDRYCSSIWAQAS